LIDAHALRSQLVGEEDAINKSGKTAKKSCCGKDKSAKNQLIFLFHGHLDKEIV